MSNAPPRVNVGILVGGLVLVGLLVAVLAKGFDFDPHAVPSVLENTPAPDFTLQTLDGKPFHLKDGGQQITVVNFWSTWCQPCKIEHPLLLKGPTKWPNVRWVGVIYSDDTVQTEAYLKKHGAAYPHLVDPGGRVAIDYGVAGVPETYFIDESGTIVYKQSGPLSEELLVQLLGPEAP